MIYSYIHIANSKLVLVITNTNTNDEMDSC